MLMFLTLCLVGVILGGMENIEGKTEWKTLFSTVWEREENRESGKSGRKFSLPGPQILSPQIGKKMLRGKLIKNTLSIMPSGIKLKKKKKKKRRAPENENCTYTSWKIGMLLKEEDKANKRRR